MTFLASTLGLAVAVMAALTIVGILHRARCAQREEDELRVPTEPPVPAFLRRQGNG